jgi:PAS domain S-box-containing protein
MAKKQVSARENSGPRNKKRPGTRRVIASATRLHSRRSAEPARKKNKAISKTDRRTSNGGIDGANSIQGESGKPARRSVFREPKSELEQAIQRYIDLFELAPIGYVTFDRVGRIEEINFAAVRLLGRSRRQLIGITFAVCVAKEDTQRFLNHLLECRTSDRSVVTELHLKQQNGEKIPVLLSSTASFGLVKDGAILYQTAIVDLTQRKRAEEAQAEAARQQGALYEFSRRYQAATTLDEIYDAALDAILTALPCDRASILLHDQQQVMRFVAWRGLSEKYRKAVEGHSPWKPDAKNPQPVCIEDIDVADISKSLKSTIRREGISAVAFIPLVSGQKLVGKFMIYHNAPHPFVAEELKLASTIARQLVQVIERKRDEAALREKEAELELIVTETPFMLTRCSRDLRYRYASRAYAEMIGRKPEEIAGKPLVEIMGKEGLATIWPHIQRVLAGETVVYEAKVPFRNHGTHFLHGVYVPDKDEKGEVIGWIASLVDVTEQKHAEEALRESRERLRTIVDQASAGIARYDREGHIQFVNQTFCRMLGYLDSELIGKSIHEITHADDMEKTLHAFERVWRKAKLTVLDKRYIRKDGSVIWVNVSDAPERDASGRPKFVVAVAVDITERKKAEAALQRSKELLEERVRERTSELKIANKELEAEIERRKGLEGEILAVSDREQQRLGQELHDGLCQHLTAVAFMTRSIALRLKNHRVIDVVDIDKIAELVNAAATDTRNLSRALHRLDVDAAGFIAALEDLVDREIWRTPCRLEVKPSFRIDDDAAAAHLYRIAREAVINANKHAHAREIVVRLEGSRQGAVLRVIDDGIGVSSEPTVKTGLGMHIMNYRAQVLGGRLEVDRPKAGGTCVSCYLPNHGPRKSHEKETGHSQRLLAKTMKALAGVI